MTALVLSAARAPARATIARHSRSFALASRLLGARIRDQTAVVYTWCRRADDTVDGGDGDVARLRAELDAVYAGRATDPVLAAFAEVVRARRIPRRYPDELLAGMAMDATGARYRTLDDLLVYAWRVAGVVGLMMAHVFGVRADAALAHAAQLGIAMQLTNISRDVAEDAARGRVYVPEGMTVAELLAVADRYYRAADRGMRALPWRAGLATRAARNVYAAIGTRIARGGFDVSRRTVVPAAGKLAGVAAALGRSVVALPACIVAPRARIPTRTLEIDDVPRP